MQFNKKDELPLRQSHLRANLMSAKLAQISMFVCQAAEAVPDQSLEVHFPRLLQACEEIDLFLDSGCLNFGLDVIGGVLTGLLFDFQAVAEILAEKAVHQDQSTRRSLDEALAICQQILEMLQPKPH